MSDELEPRARHAAESARGWGRDEAASSGAAALAKVRAVAAGAPDEPEGGRLRLVLLAAAAAVVVVGGFGLVFAARGGSNDVIGPATSPSVEPTAPLGPNTSEATPVATTDGDAVTTSAPPADVDPEPVIIEYPTLPASITERWATTINGSFPQSAVRIDDVIVFGQVDLPGVKAVDARSGELLWSVELGDEDLVSSLVVVDGRIVVNTFEAQSEPVAIVLDTSGNVVRTIQGAQGFPGAVVRLVTIESSNRLERIGEDGAVVRSVDVGTMLPFVDEPQFEVRGDSGSTWYDFPSLERIAGPLTVGLDADEFNATSTATTEFVATLNDSTLRFLDAGGAELATLDLDAVGRLAPIVSDEPSVLVEALEQPDNGRAKPGDVVRAYRLVSGEIVELWARPGRLTTVIDRAGRTYAVVTDLLDETGNEPSAVIDAATGNVVISGGFYQDDEEASNGFVFFVSDDVAERQTVAYDIAGRELWRILGERLDGTGIVDRGVLVGNVDSVAKTVDLTFYD